MGSTEGRRSMRSSRVIGGLGIVAASLGVALTASPAGALTTVCMARTPATAGKVPWTLRQASGLTSLPGRGRHPLHPQRPRPAAPPAPTRTPRNAARVGDQARRHAAGAVSPDRRARTDRPSPTSTPRPSVTTRPGTSSSRTRARTSTTVWSSPSTGSRRPRSTPNQAYVEQDVPAEIIPIAYYNSATTQAQVQLNVESMAIDAAGERMVHPPEVGQAVRLRRDRRRASTPPPGRAPRPGPVRSSQLDRGRTGDGRLDLGRAAPMLVVKTTTTAYAYLLNGRAASRPPSPARRPAPWPRPRRRRTAGYGEAVVARRTTGASPPWPRAPKTAHSGSASAVWSFAP